VAKRAEGTGRVIIDREEAKRERVATVEQERLQGREEEESRRKAEEERKLAQGRRELARREEERVQRELARREEEESRAAQRREVEEKEIARKTEVEAWERRLNEERVLASEEIECLLHRITARLSHVVSPPAAPSPSQDPFAQTRQMFQRELSNLCLSLLPSPSPSPFAHIPAPAPVPATAVPSLAQSIANAIKRSPPYSFVSSLPAHLPYATHVKGADATYTSSSSFPPSLQTAQPARCPTRIQGQGQGQEQELELGQGQLPSASSTQECTVCNAHTRHAAATRSYTYASSSSPPTCECCHGRSYTRRQTASTAYSSRS
jgi:hypothetical protein